MFKLVFPNPKINYRLQYIFKLFIQNMTILFHKFDYAKSIKKYDFLYFFEIIVYFGIIIWHNKFYYLLEYFVTLFLNLINYIVDHLHFLNFFTNKVFSFIYKIFKIK